VANAPTIVRDYRYTSRLDRHQWDVLAVLSVPELQGLALFDEQGTGKTV
jgi:hypothetical protein